LDENLLKNLGGAFSHSVFNIGSVKVFLINVMQLYVTSSKCPTNGYSLLGWAILFSFPLIKQGIGRNRVSKSNLQTSWFD